VRCAIQKRGQVDTRLCHGEAIANPLTRKPISTAPIFGLPNFMADADTNIEAPKLNGQQLSIVMYTCQLKLLKGDPVRADIEHVQISCGSLWLCRKLSGKEGAKRAIGNIGSNLVIGFPWIQHYCLTYA
jgi:hypothetical protein